MPGVEWLFLQSTNTSTTLTPTRKISASCSRRRTNCATLVMCSASPSACSCAAGGENVGRGARSSAPSIFGRGTTMAEKRRKRIGKGIYRDKYGISATVKVGTGIASIQREKRYPFDTSLKDIKAWQEAMRGELRTAAKRPTTA